MQLLLFLAIVLLLSTVWYAKKETLSTRDKVILVSIMLLTIGLAGVYEWRSAQKSAHNREMVSAFKQGKTLLCSEKEVNQESFIFVSGTMSFIPNESNKQDKGVVIDIFTCKIK